MVAGWSTGAAIMSGVIAVSAVIIVVLWVVCFSHELRHLSQFVGDREIKIAIIFRFVKENIANLLLFFSFKREKCSEATKQRAECSIKNPFIGDQAPLPSRK